MNTEDIFNTLAEQSAKHEVSLNPNVSFEQVKKDNLEYLSYLNQLRFKEDIMAFDRMIQTMLERHSKSENSV